MIHDESLKPKAEIRKLKEIGIVQPLMDANERELTKEATGLQVSEPLS
jgi:hypothetical protein